MTSITRTALDRCSTKDCPRPNDREWHDEWMERCANGAEHGHRHDQPTHAHFPKKGMGGNNPLSKIVAVICWPLHDSVDNGLNGMGVFTDIPEGTGYVRFWDVHNRTIVRGPSATAEDVHAGEASAVAPGASSDGGERDGHGDPVASDSPPSPDAGADSREALAGSSSAAVTRSSAAKPSGGDGGIATRPQASQELPSPPTTQEEQDEERKAVLDKRGRAGQDDSESEHAVDSRISASTTYSPDRRHRDSNRQTDVAAPISESLKPNGLDLPPEFTFEEWTDLAGMVAGMNKNRQWWAGDLVLAGERFGERATNFWNDLGYRWESLSNAVRVCRRFPRPLRHESLQFSHHAVVYALDDDEAHLWLTLAYNDSLTVKQLREAVHGVKPKTVRYTISGLREDLAAWPGEPKVRNNGRKFAEAWLDSLEAS